VGTVFLLASYVRLLETPVKHIRRQMEGLQRAFASIGRVDDFLQLQPKVREQVSAVLPTGPLSVTFDSVTFTYKDRLSLGEMQVEQPPDSTDPDRPSPNGQPTVLYDVAFSLAPGRVLGILGRTGSGKTTLTRLLFRLYDVDAGAIRLGGVDVREAALSDLRQRVGMVTQDVQLFAATVRDNLTLFNNHDPDAAPISDERILAALHTLGLAEWLAGLPEGLDTRLIGGGQGLSAGQAQLLAFTRVFLRSPQLVVLDEASSRLDPATEQLLEQAIDQLLTGRTGIIIAHRLRTVQRADDILILENGRILEFGPRKELAANPNSRFSHLLRTGLEEVLE
jgi:ABC-type multidrug transport system fused ATPase/permease subunit